MTFFKRLFNSSSFLTSFFIFSLLVFIAIVFSFFQSFVLVSVVVLGGFFFMKQGSLLKSRNTKNYKTVLKNSLKSSLQEYAYGTKLGDIGGRFSSFKSKAVGSNADLDLGKIKDSVGIFNQKTSRSKSDQEDRKNSYPIMFGIGGSESGDKALYVILDKAALNFSDVFSDADVAFFLVRGYSLCALTLPTGSQFFPNGVEAELNFSLGNFVFSLDFPAGIICYN